MINLAIVPASTMCTYPFMWACRKAPSISVTATYPPYFASMCMPIIASKDMVGELVSAFILYSCCELPSAHPLALMLLSRFSLRNIRYLGLLSFVSVTCLPFYWAVALVVCVIDLILSIVRFCLCLRISLCPPICSSDSSLHAHVALKFFYLFAGLSFTSSLLVGLGLRL